MCSFLVRINAASLPNLPCNGHTLCCAIGVGTSRGTLSRKMGILSQCRLQNVGIRNFAHSRHLNKFKCCNNTHSSTPQGVHLMVCNRSLNLSVNPKLVWHPAYNIKEWGCVDLSMDTLHLKYPLVLFGSEGSALTLPLFLLSPRIIMLCHCSSTMTKDHFFQIPYGTK